MKTKKQIQQGCTKLLPNRKYIYCKENNLCSTCQAQLEMIGGFEKLIDEMSIKYGGEINKYKEGEYECLKLIKELKQKING